MYTEYAAKIALYGCFCAVTGTWGTFAVLITEFVYSLLLVPITQVKDLTLSYFIFDFLGVFRAKEDFFYDADGRRF